MIPFFETAGGNIINVSTIRWISKKQSTDALTQSDVKYLIYSFEYDKPVEISKENGEALLIFIKDFLQNAGHTIVFSAKDAKTKTD